MSKLPNANALYIRNNATFPERGTQYELGTG